jgi:hypothetical protein
MWKIICGTSRSSFRSLGRTRGSLSIWAYLKLRQQSSFVPFGRQKMLVAEPSPLKTYAIFVGVGIIPEK